MLFLKSHIILVAQMMIAIQTLTHRGEMRRNFTLVNIQYKSMLQH